MTYDRIFVDGEWVASGSKATIAVENPASEESFAAVPAGAEEDIEHAVEAARRAFQRWSQTHVEERVALLDRIREQLELRADAIADTISHEMGAPISFSRAAQVPLPLRGIASTVRALERLEPEEEVGSSLVVREPAGVVAAITPWNFPLHQIAAKVAPALAAGCTVVLKPSTLAPLNALQFAEVVEAADAPPGVFNLVCGGGQRIGEALITHEHVDVVSFTGSTEVGRRVAELAASAVRKVALELGGKSANVVLDDADLDEAIPGAVRQCLANSGQTCAALSRLLVPRSQLAEVEERAVAAAESWTIGDPSDPQTKLGPVVSAAQRETIRRYIDSGIEEGARLLTGGPGAPSGLDRGYYVLPTVFSDVRPEMTIAREEIFGPVLSITAYDTEEEAVALANDSDYGLSGGVWSTSLERAAQVARRIRTGHVVLNGSPLDVEAPFGGYKQSGTGREFGRYGIEEFLEVKAIQGALPA